MVDRPTVLLAMKPSHVDRLLDPHLLRRLTAVAEVDTGLVVDDFSTTTASGALASTEVLFTCWGCPPISAEVLMSAPRLRAVVHAAGSVKNLITPACWEAGIRVSSAAAANAVPVAEFTVAMIVLANKRVHRIVPAFRTDTTRRDWASSYPHFGNYGMTVGLVGASRVGRKVAELLRGYDFEVLLADPTLGAAEADALGARLVDLDTLVGSCDVVSLHAPDIPATRHLLDARRLGLLPDGATLINTARGRLVDTDALTCEVGSGRINAVLDVTEPEPLPVDHPLLGLSNVVVTPHIAGSLGNEIRRMGDLAVGEVERYARGAQFAHPVREQHLDSLA